jgi:hypothetical protein
MVLIPAARLNGLITDWKWGNDSPKVLALVFALTSVGLLEAFSRKRVANPNRENYRGKRRKSCEFRVKI